MINPIDLILDIVSSSWQIFRESSFYVLFGLLLAGLLRVFFQPSTVGRYFRDGNVRSVLYASLIGIPLPL
jgi:uncharacterized protein